MAVEAGKAVATGSMRLTCSAGQGHYCAILDSADATPDAALTAGPNC